MNLSFSPLLPRMMPIAHLLSHYAKCRGWHLFCSSLRIFCLSKNSICGETFTVRHAFYVYLAASAVATAEIDSGGGKTQIGNLTNHASIGGFLATTPAQIATTTNKTGLIEVLYSAGVPTDPDANGNGLPDEWENTHFPGLTVDPDADDDGDGTTNRMEYIAGTNPRLASSAFKPNGSYSNGVFSMPLQTMAGRSYRVFATNDLMTWHLQQTFTGDGTAKVFVFDETTVTAGPISAETHPSTYFFRVEVSLP